MQMRLRTAVAAVVLMAAECTWGYEVRQVFRPERFSRGDVNLRIVQPIDDAAWIWTKGAETAPDASRPFVRFRRAFAGRGERLRIDVSADARFVLLLDGEEIARGPHQGCVDHWYYETYDITGLGTGLHLMEAVVFDLGSRGPLAILSSGRGGFILKAEGAYDGDLTTGKAGWQAAVLKSTAFGEPTCDIVMTGAENIVCGTGFLDERDRDWHGVRVVKARILENPYGAPANGWALFPTERPDPVCRTVVPGTVRAAQPAFDQTNLFYSAEDADRDWTVRFDALVRRGEPVEIPANTEVRFLWDFGDYYCAFPILETQGGKGAKVRWTWAENLCDAQGIRGNRDEFTGKRVGKVMWDTFLPDGRSDARFTIPWWKSGRWAQIAVRTADAPLVLKQIAIRETRYPLEPAARFECDDATIADVQRICVRGLQNCMHETLMDCPYYEQQMYPGDSRVEMLTLNAITGDARMIRYATGIYDYGRRNNGMIPMNFPTRLKQDSTTYSMCWAMMVGDYALWHGADDFLKARMPGLRHTLDAISLYENRDGLLEGLPGWSFMDWVPEWGRYGIAPDGGLGVSAVNNLLYVYALRSAASAESALGDDEMANKWRSKAARVGAKAVELFWNEERGLMADDVGKDRYSEHAQCLALLTDALSGERASRAFKGLLEAKDLARTTVYFSHYLFDTFLRYGRADLFLRRLDLWRDYVRMGLRTPLESPGEKARSDCHAWGSHPLYHLHTGVAGVRPATVGYGAVTVAPQPGGLKWIRSATPTPKGPVSLDLRFEGDEVSGTVSLPKGLPGAFVWNGRSVVLEAGENDVGMLTKEKRK